MARATLCDTPLMEPPFLDLRLTRTEAKVLRAVLGGMVGGYEKPLEMSSDLKDSSGELRRSLDAIWIALDEAGSL